ncbi:MAG TPA: choice-of-anchor D domain-containing protein, partial [Candidatus Sulfotelmatobacter sp.]|nr:choice-of-anchor D domain-containing protein [Candidatus Sulfotelmatobacter sp.]
SGAGFNLAGPALPVTVAPQGSVNLSVAFDPLVAGSVSGGLTVSGSGSWGGRNKTHTSSGSVALAGTGMNPPPAPGYLSAPSSMNLGSVLVGSSQTQSLTLSNTGGSSLTISAASVSGAGFNVSGLSYPFTLNAGSTAVLAVTFAPSVSGNASATLTLSSNASDPSVNVALSGSGTAPSGTLSVTPGSMSFGDVDVGNSSSQNGSLTASGGSVVLSSASSTNSEFKLGTLSLPATIAAGQSLSFTLTFAPTTPGTASASISFVSGSGTISQSASGTGATIQHTVDLSWNASTSTSVTGYNVYRATTSGGPYAKINPSLEASMNYSDSTVLSGQTYYYVTTAVDPAGLESDYSNQAQAAVPMP